MGEATLMRIKQEIDDEGRDKRAKPKRSVGNCDN
jgi:hypothetical protein